MVFHTVKRRLEVLLVMARGTVATRHTCSELPPMNVFVTIGTQRVRNRFTEVAVGMALKTRNVTVFSQ